jgi:hypothetical protein
MQQLGAAEVEADGHAAQPRFNARAFAHAGHGRHLGQHVRGHLVVDLDEHHRAAAPRLPAHGHARDVDVALAQRLPEVADHARRVVVPARAAGALRDRVDLDAVHVHRAEGLRPKSVPATEKSRSEVLSRMAIRFENATLADEVDSTTAIPSRWPARAR